MAATDFAPPNVGLGLAQLAMQIPQNFRQAQQQTQFDSELARLAAEANGGPISAAGIARAALMSGNGQLGLAAAQLAAADEDRQWRRTTDARNFEAQRSDTRFNQQAERDRLRLAERGQDRADVPAGYERAPGGQGLRPIPGGPAAELSADERRAIREADDAIGQARQSVGHIRQAIALNDRAYQGPGASTRATIAGAIPEGAPLIGGMRQGGVDTQRFENLMQAQVLGTLRATFGGNPTEGERRILLDVEGAVNRPVEVRREILNRALAAAEERIRSNTQRAQELRERRYFQPGTQRAPTASAPAPTSASVSTPQGVPPAADATQPDPLEGRTIINRATGQRMIRRGGQWVPVE